MTNIKDFYLSDFKSKKHSPVLSSGDTKDTPNKQYNKNKQSTSVKKYTQSQIDNTGDKLYNEDQKYTEANMYMAPKLIQPDVQYISPKEYSTKKEHIAPKEHSVPEQYSAPKEYSTPKYNTDKTADDFIQGSYTTSRPWAFFSRGDSWIPPFTLPFPIELFPTEKTTEKQDRAYKPPSYHPPPPSYHPPPPSYHAPAPVYHAPAPAHPPPYKAVYEVDFTPIFLSLLPLFMALGALLGLAFSGLLTSSTATNYVYLTNTTSGASTNTVTVNVNSSSNAATTSNNAAANTTTTPQIFVFPFPIPITVNADGTITIGTTTTTLTNILAALAALIG